MDYLHGDVAPDELQAACCYEYARKSNVLCKAASLQKKSGGGEADILAVSELVDREFHCGPWFCQWPWLALWWLSPSFPSKAWTQLDEEQRGQLLIYLPLPSNRVHPLRLGEVMFLTPVFDAFQALADKARTEIKEKALRGEPRQKVYPVFEVKNTPLAQVLLPFDFSKTKKRILQEIDKWLQLPENKARFEKHKRRTESGTPKEAKDRLKDLAACKLYRELGWVKALEFAENNRKRNTSGTPRAFHDPRQGQSKKVPYNDAPLYSEQSGFLKARARRVAYLEELIPWEFGRIAEERERQKTELHQAFSSALKKAQKISRSSS
jgi:hypothetical protein